MTTRMINWSKVPVGAATNYGAIISNSDNSIIFINSGAQVTTMYVGLCYDWRLLEQTKFTYQQAGTPPIVEGLVFEYEYIVSISGTPVRRWASEITFIPSWGLIIAYRVVGIDRANGWTDNPEEAK